MSATPKADVNLATREGSVPATPGSTEEVGQRSINSISTTPSYYGATGPSATSSIGLPDFAVSAPPTTPSTAAEYPLRWGPFTAHPHLTYDFTYATGVLINPGETTTSAVHAVSPGLTIESKHITIDYTASINTYSQGPYKDSVNHFASLRSSFGYGDWAFTLDQSYSKANNPLIETGTQTETESFNTQFGALWNLNEKVFFDFSISQQFQDSKEFQSYSQWSTMDWVNYRVTREFSVGAGVGFGYSDVEVGSDMTYEQFQGRINWHPAPKLSVNLSGGVEIRQFLANTGAEDLLNPIMSGSVSYQIFEATSLYFSADRSVNNSLFSNQIVETGSLSGGINQRFFRHFNLALTGGYRNSDYKSTTALALGVFNSGRTDEYTFVSVGLGTTFLRKGTVSIGYLHGQNNSSAAGYTYDSDQVTFLVGYRF